MKVFNVVFIDREKNAQTLLEMEMVPADRTKVLENLKTEDYCKGPLENSMHGAGRMWEFGKNISGTDIYIKIAMGRENNSVICISFHTAEQPLQYPYKE
ncbi:MAG: hypothetical protein WD059_09025 [Balneolaceae bacterium]